MVILVKQKHRRPDRRLRGLLNPPGFLAAVVLTLAGCGSPPEPFPPPDSGAIRVSAFSSATIDSVLVHLDDLAQGVFANPCTLRSVVAGTHKLTVVDSTGARTDTMVSVRKDELTSTAVRLTRIGPYVGNEAPDFAVKDIDGRQFSLGAQRGRVVFVSFFEYT
jgi:hypothetical protein